MKVLLIGASGVIGSAVKKVLETDHEVIAVTHSSGDLKVNIEDPESIKAMFKTVGPVDAIVSATGGGSIAPLNSLTDADYELALNNKLMGQVNLVRLGQEYLTKNGSITLTSGIASQVPIPGGAAISMACGALESFVKAAALELDSLRVNVVSPIFVKETMAMMGMDTAAGLSAADTAKAYEAAVHGTMSGETLNVPEFRV